MNFPADMVINTTTLFEMTIDAETSQNKKSITIEAPEEYSTVEDLFSE